MKKYRSNLIFFLNLIVIHLLGSLNLAAQSSDYRFISLSAENGLSNNNVVCILQDIQGFMWFGTEDGLNRYDGTSFKVYRNNPDDPNSLVSNNISSILQDNTGDIWVGTKGGGLNRFKPELDVFTHYLHDTNDSSSLCSNEVLSIFQDSNMHIWIGTDGGGISKYNRDEDNFINYSSGKELQTGLISNEILSIAEDSYGNIWFGTWGGGLHKLAQGSTKYNHYPLTYRNNADKLIENVWSIFPSSKDHLWIGMWGEGFGRVDITKQEYKPLLYDATNKVGGVNNVWNVFENPDGIVWIGTDKGLFLYFPESEVFQQIEYKKDLVEGINSNKVLCVYEDRNKSVWIGTDKGINVYFPYRKKFKKFNEHTDDGTVLSKDNITTVLEDQGGNIWIGTEDLGLFRYNASSEKLEQFENIDGSIDGNASGKINKLFIDSQNILWIGTRYGLSRYDINQNQFSSYNIKPDRKSSANEVMDICEESDSVLWIGTDDGLYQLNKLTGEFRNFCGSNQDNLKLNSNHILSLKKDSSGTLWVGSWEGINKYDKTGKKHEIFQHDFQNPNSLGSNYVYVIYQDRLGEMWFGTRGGLCKLDSSKKQFINFREKNGLPSDVINGILEDDHKNLWLSTNQGLSRYNKDSCSFTNFDQYDGIQGSQFSIGSCFRSKSGTMYFGGTNGLSIFHPDSIHINQTIPEVWITGLHIGAESAEINIEGSPLKKHVSHTDQIILSYKQKDLSFDFVALNYLSSSKNQYAYKLESQDDNNEEWIYIGNRRTAYFTNISPGEYTFHVKASNNDNQWNETGASLKIVIEPPFWSTLWFKILLVFAFYTIGYLLFKLRMYRVKIKNRILEAQVQERTREVVQQKEDLAVQAKSLSKANKSIISKNLQLEESAEKIRIQADEIFHMNELLAKENINLEENLHDLAMARVMQKRVSFKEFKQIYPDTDSCKQFLFELKEQRTYKCIKCGSLHYSVNNIEYSRRCSKCGYNESVTVGTIFYRIKFPIDKAFYILYLVSMGRELTVDELSGLISLRRETCWAFRNKVMEVMKKHKRFKNPREGWKELILSPKY